MLRIAIIITAYNRKDKTLSCIERLTTIPNSEIDLSIYLTDDGSTDGTAEAVTVLYPQVTISHGNGNLYWGGGTNLSWKRAVSDGNFDGYVWLNDDTILSENVWNEIIAANEYCKNTYDTGGIYIGSTLSPTTNKISYGGWIQIHPKKSSFRILEPNGRFQPCDIGNGNITYISNDVVKKIGCLYEGYIHGADFDYTYWAHTEKFPLLILRDYVGYCENDHKSHKENLLKLNLIERIKYLYSPTGLQFKTALLFQKRFFPHNTWKLWMKYWIKTLFPQLMK